MLLNKRNIPKNTLLTDALNLSKKEETKHLGGGGGVKNSCLKL